MKHAAKRSGRGLWIASSRNVVLLVSFALTAVTVAACAVGPPWLRATLVLLMASFGLGLAPAILWSPRDTNPLAVAIGLSLNIDILVGLINLVSGWHSWYFGVALAVATVALDLGALVFDRPKKA